MNNSLGSFGPTLGKNWGIESSFGAAPGTSQMSLLHQLIAHQNGCGGGDSQVGSLRFAQGLIPNSENNINALSGNKRINESGGEDGGAVKKQQTASL